MGKKLFISFLGASMYEDCIYYDNQHDYPKTLFIQEATLRQIGAENWKETDSVKIFLTDLAYENNWDRNIHSRINYKKEVVPYVGLEKIIDDMHLACDTTPVTHVPLGKNEDELWQIFNLIYDQIEEGDELYIDLTHAFRYLPMLLLVLSNYAKFLRNVTIKHISYGSYEGRDPKTNRAPIIDLLPLSKLQDWTTAASEFIKYGDAEGLNRLTEDNLNDIFVDKSRTAEEKKQAGIVKSFTSALNNYSLERITCRGKDIVESKASKSLSRQIAAIEGKLNQDTGLKPLNPIFKEIGKTIMTSDSSLDNCLDAAKWCYKKHMYQQAITLLEEGIITFFCERHGIAINDKYLRKLIVSAFSIKRNNTSEKEWDVEDGEKDKMRELLSDKLLSNAQLANCFGDVINLRNDYNHANFRNENRKAPTIIDTIKDEINTCGSLLMPNFEKIK